MKKLCLLFIALIILISLNTSYGFVNQRYGWWKVRLKDLSQEKDKLIKNNNLYESVTNLINNDIKRAKKILSIFESNGSDDISNNYEKKKYTGPEIQEKLKNIYTPIFSLKYLDFVINNIGRKDVDKLTEKSVNSFFACQIPHNHSQDGSINKREITKESFFRNDWKYLSMEIFLEIMILNRERLFDQSLSGIEKIIFSELSKNNFLYEPVELADIINNASNEHLINYNIVARLDCSGINTQSSAYWSEKRKPAAGDPQKSVDNTKLLEAIRLRFVRNSRYIDLVTGLVKDCSGLNVVDSSSANKRFYSLVIKISNLLNLIQHSLTTDKEMLNRLKETELNELNIIKTDIADSVKKAKSDINETYSLYSREQEKRRNKLNDPQNNLREKIAECEMDLFLDSIRDYMKEFKNLNYNYNALLNYSNKYIELQEEVNNNKTSGSLEYAIKTNSIFPLLKDFNINKIKKEHETKHYLTNVILRDIARMETLASIYKREDIKIKYTARSDLNAIKEKLRLKEEVKIGSWIMNDVNFEKIDKKAVQKLNIGINKNIWKKKNGSQKDISEVNDTIKVDKVNIAFAIPKGWVKQNLNENESAKGIIRSYKSIDGKSLIYFAGIESDGKSEKEAAELWIKKMKSRKVMHSWGKKNKMEYFWTLSNNGNNEIMEAYAISCGNYIFVLSGISSKEKYNLFKEKIASVFESMSI